MKKVNVEISEELYHELSELLPHGTKRAVVTHMLWDLVDLLHTEHRKEALGAILSEALAYPDYSSTNLSKYADDSRPRDTVHGEKRGRTAGDSPPTET